MNKQEIERIKTFYEKKEKETTKVEELKALNKKVKKPTAIFAYIFGSISTLLFGVGICFCLGAIGGSSLPALISGVAIGVIGIALVSLTYPIYKGMINKRKAVYGEKILNLSNELLNEKI